MFSKYIMCCVIENVDDPPPPDRAGGTRWGGGALSVLEGLSLPWRSPPSLYARAAPGVPLLLLGLCPPF